mmetsp:Transcript_1609/g.1095  ORF Transcript_1609/g.1095 Transcript_1609/m.1095 type:complete len:94 (+) Transcript_1609:386-667(+)|eukprot:CAMPEP_0202968796 /NCGR_PEP_ID=MMETSP1396-20130829/14245_1 /ASSEMBLY_ACC=CAM_ASM_000872 /TAXON_ID= /ORGANISM="Pseudokeronopsis sp., Strain Brazil" /LENGTH=93 /DNA_ID=CAMNT_0049695529 /DNA_START=377 /DNA_END=658 /DNA_ORIENTATION=+
MTKVDPVLKEINGKKKASLENTKSSQQLQVIKESNVDLSYLKNVKSKINCWANPAPVLRASGTKEEDRWKTQMLKHKERMEKKQDESLMKKGF